MKHKLILDACCGSRMFWFDKNRADTVYMDIRDESHTLCAGGASLADKQRYDKADDSKQNARSNNVTK